MKVKNRETGEWLTIPLGGTTIDYDQLPVGSIVDYDGDTVPLGYERTEDETEGGTWIGSDTPSAAYNLWIDPTEDEMSATTDSEVVNSMSGSETDKAPSVAAVKSSISGKIINSSSTNYIKFDDGTLICYGVLNVPGLAVSGTSSVSVTFPVAFSSTSYRASLSRSSTAAYWTWVELAVTSKTASGMTVSTYNNATSASSAITADWIVIGRWK